MQRVVIDQPYNFIPPRYSRLWHGMVRMVLPGLLRKQYGISHVECVGAEKLRASLQAGHGVVIAGNHCRPCDPMVLDSLAAAVRRPFHIISSWHVFMTSRIQKFLLPRLGGFSIHREGMDRESLKCAVRLVAEGKHPLVIFPEGIITRSNDRLVHLMEGPAFVARNAAKQKTHRKVHIHPVFIRYIFEGDLEATLMPVIEEIEGRLSWRIQSDMPLMQRIAKLGDALLALKEIEHLQSPQTGSTAERIQRLIDHLLIPLETQWTAGRHDGDAMSRVKRLRAAIMPDLAGGDLAECERSARWRQLADLYLVQQLHCYPGGYFENPTPERLIETVERYEEDLTDQARPHAPIRAIITVGDAIEVDAGREQSTESITVELRQRLEAMLEETRR
jgi:1-acyl-sn-glycerol-3-phosphate acyltransferase